MWNKIKSWNWVWAVKFALIMWMALVALYMIIGILHGWMTVLNLLIGQLLVMPVIAWMHRNNPSNSPFKFG